MNLFDKEERIIDRFQDLRRKEVLIYPKNFEMLKIYKSIHRRRSWKKWTNSSGKSELPPDYYNEKDKIMMDVMRIDDHAFVNEDGRVINPHNQRESKLIKELSEKSPSLKEAAIEGRLIIIPDSGLRGYQDHNYDFYIKNFQRVIEKHITKIPLYQHSHPNFKTIFLIFDESSPYMQCLDEKRPTKAGEIFFAEPHLWWLDNNMIKIIKDSKIDYLVWVTPFKYFDSVEKVVLPQAVIYDVSKIKYDKLIKYKNNDMQSAEM